MRPGGRRRPRDLVPAALLAALGLATAAPHALGLDWSARERLSAAGVAARDPEIALTPGPGGIVIWRAGGAGGTGRVQAVSAARLARGFGRPRDISVSRVVSFSRLAVAAGAGGAVAIWTGRPAGSERVEAADRPSGAAFFGAAQPVSPDGGFRPDAAVAPEGTAHAVWERIGRIEAARRPAGATAWELPRPVAEGAQVPRIAVDAAGNAVAVFRRGTGPSTRAVATAALAVGGGDWTSTGDIAGSQEGPAILGPGYPSLAVDAGGRAVAAWTRLTRQGGVTTIQAAILPGAGEPWGRAVDLTPPTGNAFAPQVAVDGRGDGIAVWSRARNGRTFIQTALLRGGRWSAPRALTPPDDQASNPRVAMSEAGDALVVWTRSQRGRLVVQGMQRLAGSAAWRGPWTLSRTGRGRNGFAPQVAVAQRDGLVVWYERVGRANAGVVSARAVRLDRP